MLLRHCHVSFSYCRTLQQQFLPVSGCSSNLSLQYSNKFAKRDFLVDVICCTLIDPRRIASTCCSLCIEIIFVHLNFLSASCIVPFKCKLEPEAIRCSCFLVFSSSCSAEVSKWCGKENAQFVHKIS